MKKRFNRFGFTLAEVMTALVIVGFLAAIAFPNYLRYVNRMKAKEGEELLMTLLGAEKRYYADNGAYTGTIGNLDVEVRPPQYFTPQVLVYDPTTMPHNEVGLVTAKSGVGFQYQFGLVIDINGTVACDNLAAPIVAYCQSLGFNAPF